MLLVYSLKMWFNEHCSRRVVLCVCLALLTVVPLILNAKPRLYLPTLHGYIRDNFRQRWLRVTLPATLASEARRKAALPKYLLPQSAASDGAFTYFPIYVVSLKNATKRRESVQQQLGARNIAFQFFDAVDGREPIPSELARWYLSGNRWQQFQRSQPGSVWHRYLASKLSHLRLMHTLIAGGGDMQLVLEDDFELADENGDFLSRLREVMSQLPEDWEVLWLHDAGKQAEINRQANTWVGQGVRLGVRNNWSLGLLYRRSFALKVLNDAQMGDKDYDDLANDICALGNAACYTAYPPLVWANFDKFESQIVVPGG